MPFKRVDQEAVSYTYTANPRSISTTTAMTVKYTKVREFIRSNKPGYSG